MVRTACGTFLPVPVIMPGPARATRYCGEHGALSPAASCLQNVRPLRSLSRMCSTTPSSLFAILLPTVLLLPQCLHRATTSSAPEGPSLSRPSSHVRRYASSCWDMTKASSVVFLPIPTSLMPWAILALL